jgi:hypothetical protein
MYTASKVKLFATRHGGNWVGRKHMPVLDHVSQCIGYHAAPRGSVDTETSRKILSPPGIEPRSFSLQSGTILNELPHS